MILSLANDRSSHQRGSVKKLFLKFLQNSQENTCAKVFFLIKMQAQAQVFSCEFCKISNNTFAYRIQLLLQWLVNKSIPPNVLYQVKYRVIRFKEPKHLSQTFSDMLLKTRKNNQTNITIWFVKSISFFVKPIRLEWLQVNKM